MRREVSKPRTTKLHMRRPAPAPLTDGVVTLRLPGATDLDRLARYGADESLLEGVWVGWPRQGEDPHEWASRCVADWLAAWTDEGGMDGGALVVDEVHPFVGIVFFVPWSRDVVELVYGVQPTVRGRGIAKRAARLAADWALEEGGFARVELRIGESHVVSRRVAERAGFTYEETFETFVVGTGNTHRDTLYARTR